MYQRPESQTRLADRGRVQQRQQPLGVRSQQFIKSPLVRRLQRHQLLVRLERAVALPERFPRPAHLHVVLDDVRWQQPSQTASLAIDRGQSSIRSRVAQRRVSRPARRSRRRARHRPSIRHPHRRPHGRRARDVRADHHRRRRRGEREQRATRRVERRRIERRRVDVFIVVARRRRRRARRARVGASNVAVALRRRARCGDARRRRRARSHVREVRTGDNLALHLALTILVAHARGADGGDDEPTRPEQVHETEIRRRRAGDVVIRGDADEGAVVGEKDGRLDASEVVEHLRLPAVSNE